MSSRLCVLLVLPLLAAFASNKKTEATATGENDDLTLTVTLHTDKEDIQQLVGDELGGHYFVAEVKIQPKYGKTVTVDHDDFLLRSNADNDNSHPFAPSQVAGTGAIIISKTRKTVSAQEDPNFGGPPIYGPMGGYPMGYPGAGVNIGGGSADVDANKATVKEGTGKETPLEKSLAAKELPEKKTDQPISGLLYFAMEKQKIKNLQLEYGGKENRIVLHFNGKKSEN